MKERIYNKLERMFKENSWRPIQINMKDTGQVIRLSLVSLNDINSLSDVQYILSEGSQSGYMFSGTIDEVVDKLSHYSVIHNQWLQKYAYCGQYFNVHMKEKPDPDEHIRQYHWEIFSVLHSDIFGYEPVKNGMIFGEYFNYTAFIDGDTVKIS